MKRDYQSLLIGTISSLLAMAVYFVVESMWGEELSDSQLTVVVGIIFASIIFPLIANATKLADKSLKNRYSLILMEELKPLLTKDIKKEFEKNIGLFEIYPNFYACEQELLNWKISSFWNN